QGATPMSAARPAAEGLAAYRQNRTSSCRSSRRDGSCFAKEHCAAWHVGGPPVGSGLLRVGKETEFARRPGVNVGVREEGRAVVGFPCARVGGDMGEQLRLAMETRVLEGGNGPHH